ncbi:hypothetical protein HDU93_004611, partial [Gonapodya sp. JEL0774]
LQSLLRPGGILLADEFSRDEVTEAAAKFLFDRIDLFRAMGLMEDSSGHSHSNAHDHGGEKTHDHGHGGESRATRHDHSHRHGSESNHDASGPRSNLTYVHGHGSVGSSSDGGPREGLRGMPPLDRWKRMTSHNPPLPGGAEMLAALKAGFGEENVVVIKGDPSLYLMGTLRVKISEEHRTTFEEVFKAQEEESIQNKLFPGIGALYKCRRSQ